MDTNPAGEQHVAGPIIANDQLAAKSEPRNGIEEPSGMPAEELESWARWLCGQVTLPDLDLLGLDSAQGPANGNSEPVDSTLEKREALQRRRDHTEMEAAITLCEMGLQRATTDRVAD